MNGQKSEDVEMVMKKYSVFQDLKLPDINEKNKYHMVTVGLQY